MVVLDLNVRRGRRCESQPEPPHSYLVGQPADWCHPATARGRRWRFFAAENPANPFRHAGIRSVPSHCQTQHEPQARQLNGWARVGTKSSRRMRKSFGSASARSTVQAFGCAAMSSKRRFTAGFLEECVEIERRPLDRPATTAEVGAGPFRDCTIAVTAIAGRRSSRDARLFSYASLRTANGQRHRPTHRGRSDVNRERLLSLT
jgi:hypothetical protein